MGRKKKCVSGILGPLEISLNTEKHTTNLGPRDRPTRTYRRTTPEQSPWLDHFFPNVKSRSEKLETPFFSSTSDLISGYR